MNVNNFRFLIILISSISGYSQEVELAKETHIPLNGTLSETYNQFSGIAKWQDKILLITQYPKHIGNKIFAIDTTSINSVMNDRWNKRLKITHLNFRNLHVVEEAVNKRMSDNDAFQGFEGAVVVNNTIFLTIETEKDLCFIVKGTITKAITGDSGVITLKDTISIKKPNNKLGNAGFESIAYLPGQNKLIVFFENNMLNTPTAYLVDTLLKHISDVRFTTPLLFRLTDVAFIETRDGKDSLIGINHFYNDFKDYTKRPTEFNYYVAGDTNRLFTQGVFDTVLNEMHNKCPFTNSYTRLVGITMQKDKAFWKEEKLISYSEDNWEGIIPFKDGVLMVVDGIYPYAPCKLSYFKMHN